MSDEMKIGNYTITKTGRIYNSKGEAKKLHQHKENGHYYVRIDNRYVSLAKLVYETFSGEKIDSSMDIGYKDHNKMNVNFDNLVLVPRVRRPKRKITRETAEEIIRLHKEGMSYAKLVDMFEVSKPTLIKIVKGEYWN